jgi:transposase
MKRRSVHDPDSVVLLVDEIGRNADSRYGHRLHSVLLVARGMSAKKAADLLGDPARTVQGWVNRFEELGADGLREGERSGRPARLSKEQAAEIGSALAELPDKAGMGSGLWDGKLVAAYAKTRFGVEIGVRQCQRLIRYLGYRLRKPRPVIASANPERQAAFKKNSPNTAPTRKSTSGP